MFLYIIEKRLPFGFRGEWGKLYKLYNSNEVTGEEPNEVIVYQQSNYMDIGQDIQVKNVSGEAIKHELSQTVTNLVEKGEYMVRTTTDAYFDDHTKTYKCIVDLGDILFLNGAYWVCDKIDVYTMRTPTSQQFFHLGLKKIFDKIITGVQNA